MEAGQEETQVHVMALHLLQLLGTGQKEFIRRKGLTGKLSC